MRDVRSTARSRGQLEEASDDDGGDVELLDDGELIPAADPADPADETLRVHPLPAAEPPADDLDVSETGLELPAPGAEGEDEGEQSREAREARLDEVLHQMVPHLLESRYEEFDDESVAQASLGRAPSGHLPDEFLCSRCLLLKRRVQLADPEAGICRDCA